MSTQQTALLNKLVQDPAWNVIVDIGADLTKKYNEMGTVGVTEFETIKRSIEREAKIQVIKEFLETIEKLSQQ